MTTPPSPFPPSISLIGSGGHARVVAASAHRGGAALKAVFDTAPERVGHLFRNVTITADSGQFDTPLHVAIGSNEARRKVVQARPHALWSSVIDPRADVAEDAEIQEGALIGLGACVQTGARIGRHAIINTGAVVEHDCIVGDFAHVAPGAVLTGGVTIGEGALIGAGAVVLPGLNVGDWARVGAGSVVTRSVGAGDTVVGSPARRTDSVAT